MWVIEVEHLAVPLHLMYGFPARKVNSDYFKKLTSDKLGSVKKIAIDMKMADIFFLLIIKDALTTVYSDDAALKKAHPNLFENTI